MFVLFEADTRQTRGLGDQPCQSRGTWRQEVKVTALPLEPQEGLHLLCVRVEVGAECAQHGDLATAGERFDGQQELFPVLGGDAAVRPEFLHLVENQQDAECTTCGSPREGGRNAQADCQRRVFRQARSDVVERSSRVAKFG